MTPRLQQDRLAALARELSTPAHMVVPAAVAEHIRRLATDHPVA
jgi:hypothetical protein